MDHTELSGSKPSSVKMDNSSNVTVTTVTFIDDNSPKPDQDCSIMARNEMYKISFAGPDAI